MKQKTLVEGSLMASAGLQRSGNTPPDREGLGGEGKAQSRRRTGVDGEVFQRRHRCSAWAAWYRNSEAPYGARREATVVVAVVMAVACLAIPARGDAAPEGFHVTRRIAEVYRWYHARPVRVAARYRAQLIRSLQKTAAAGKAEESVSVHEAYGKRLEGSQHYNERVTSTAHDLRDMGTRHLFKALGWGALSLVGASILPTMAVTTVAVSGTLLAFAWHAGMSQVAWRREASLQAAANVLDAHGKRPTNPDPLTDTDFRNVVFKSVAKVRQASSSGRGGEDKGADQAAEAERKQQWGNAQAWATKMIEWAEAPNASGGAKHRRGGGLDAFTDRVLEWDLERARREWLRDEVALATRAPNGSSYRTASWGRLQQHAADASRYRGVPWRLRQWWAVIFPETTRDNTELTVVHNTTPSDGK